MAVNRGKDFEAQIKKAFDIIPEASVLRIHDQTTGFKGSSNICDFVVYHYPCQFYIECKSHYGNRLNFKSDITETQWTQLLEESKKYGVFGLVFVWFIDHDVTCVYDINDLEKMRQKGLKSVSYDSDCGYILSGVKKRVFFEYDVRKFIFDFVKLGGYLGD